MSPSVCTVLQNALRYQHFDIETWNAIQLG
jgi:hypothetical protein